MRGAGALEDAESRRVSSDLQGLQLRAQCGADWRGGRSCAGSRRGSSRRAAAGRGLHLAARAGQGSRSQDRDSLPAGKQPRPQARPHRLLEAGTLEGRCQRGPGPGKGSEYCFVCSLTHPVSWSLDITDRTTRSLGRTQCLFIRNGLPSKEWAIWGHRRKETDLAQCKGHSRWVLKNVQKFARSGR